MRKEIDCLIIGHNEMALNEYEGMVRASGKDSESYRELKLSFVELDGRICSATDVFNKFNKASDNPLTLANLFSATIACLGTFLHRRGLSFDYINYYSTQQEELLYKLQNYKILSVAITTTMYVTAFPIMEIISFIKQYNTSAKIIVGGPFVHANAATQPEEMLQYIFGSINADIYINNSQGETALAEAVGALKSGTPLDGIDNIIYRAGDSYRINPYREEDNNLNENVVDWSLFTKDVKGSVTIRTSLSCPFSCAFCTFPQRAGRYRSITLEALERELDSLRPVSDLKNINFIDDTFNVPPERFKSILKMIIQKKYNFKWNSYLRCQYIDRETVELMKESGCQGVFLGVESGSQKILQNMNKAAELEKYSKGIALLNESGILSFASFIIGFPGETYDTYMDTVRFIEDNKPTFYRTQAWYFDPLSPVWKDKEKYSLTGSKMKWSHSTMDSRMAAELVEKTFLSVKNSTWVPQFNFDFLSIFQLLNRGLEVKEIMDFINSFNDLVRHKLLNHM